MRLPPGGIASRALVKGAPLGHHSRRPNRRRRVGGGPSAGSGSRLDPSCAAPDVPRTDRVQPRTQRRGPQRAAPPDVPLDLPLDVMAWM